MGEQGTWNDRLIEAVLPDFLKNIPQEKQELLGQRYKEKVFIEYLASLSLGSTDTEKEDVIRQAAAKEKEKWGAASYEEKLNYLVPDPHLELLLDSSSRILQMAQKCVQNGTVTRDGQYDNTLKDLKYHMEHVTSAHRQRAQKIYSDAVIDLNVAYDRVDADPMRGMGML